MSEHAPTPLVSGDRRLFWPLAVVVVPAIVALPFVWSAWTVRGTLGLLSLEAALAALVLVWRDPVRFHWAARVLLGLVGTWLLALALGQTSRTSHWSERVLALAFSLACAAYAVTGSFERRRGTVEAQLADYGELVIEGRRLRLRDPRGRGGWELDTGRLLVVGEYTLEAWDDDYRLCFLCDLSGWFEAPLYAAGSTEALRRLGEELGAPLEVGLCNSTTFRSRILWPPELRGRPFLEITPRSAPSGMLEHALEFVGLRGDAGVVSSAVAEHVRQLRPDR